jgi:hypothetical protein
MNTRKLNWLKCMAAAGGVLVALGAAASPALGSTYTLNLSAPPSGAVGQPMIIQASGSNPADDFFYSYLDVDAIPASVLSSCPSGYLEASQIATSTYAQGGEWVAVAQRENVDAAGNWSMPVAYTPSVPGRFLICGYTNDGATGTLATASLAVDVQGSGDVHGSVSQECEAAWAAVKKAKKKLKEADSPSAKKKAKKKLKKAKEKRDAACS